MYEIIFLLLWRGDGVPMSEPRKCTNKKKVGTCATRKQVQRLNKIISKQCIQLLHFWVVPAGDTDVVQE